MNNLNEAYQKGYRIGYEMGLKKARKEFEKNLDEAEQIMLESMARDNEKEANEKEAARFYADKTH